MDESIEVLRRRAEFAESLLRQRDHADVVAKVEKLAQQQRDEEAKAAAERAETLKKTVEETRVGVWTNYLIAEAARRDPTAPLNAGALMASVPSQGWPPGVSPEEFHFIGQSFGGVAIDDAAETSMGRALAEMLERTSRVQRAK